MSRTPRVLAIHGMKRRWTDATLRQGLVRESAAWFVGGTDPDELGLERTFAAATFLAFAPAMRARLAAMSHPSSYADILAPSEGLLPAVLLFADEPTGQEQWHRYVWPDLPAPGTTFPYTKVARAARCVRLNGRELYVADISDAMLAEAEAEADLACPGGTATTELVKLAVNEPPPAASPAGGAGKLYRVCAILAERLRADVQPHLHRILSRDRR